MSVKVRFTICSVASPIDPKTTIVQLITMQVFGQAITYAFPEEFRDLSFHEDLMGLPAAKLAKKDLKPRWTRRAFNVTLPEKLVKVYFDDDENPIFNNKMLDDYVYSDLASSSSSTVSHSAQGVLSTNLGAAQVTSLSSITKNAVISKYGSKSHSSNAESWLQIFECECKRLLIEENRYWEVIRLFLEDSAEKWYCTTRLSNPSTSWEFWRQSFLENFGSRGLSAARSAWSYRYIAGSMSDYTQNKLNLLVSYNPKMTELDKMTHLALGLPRHLQDKINFSETSTMGKLLSQINAFDTSRSDSTRNSGLSPSSKSFCPYCKKKGFERFHAEKDCLTKARDAKYRNSGNSNLNNVKAVHSFNIDDIKNEIDNIQKNE